jgi:hypothetical protein
MAVNSNGSLDYQTPHSSQSLGAIADAPPLYGEHIIDQAYNGTCQSGLIAQAHYLEMNIPSYNQLIHASLSDAIDSTGTGIHNLASSIPHIRDYVPENSRLRGMQPEPELYSRANSQHTAVAPSPVLTQYLI